MTSTALAVVEHRSAPDVRGEEFFADIIEAIPSATPEKLAEIRAWADAAATAARIRRESDRALAAVRARILAERHLGFYLRNDPKLGAALSLSGPTTRTLCDLAAVPAELFDEVFRSRDGTQMRAGNLVGIARRMSRKRVPDSGGVEVSYDGLYWFLGKSYKSVEDAKEAMRAMGRLGTRLGKLDKVYSETRRLALNVSQLRDDAPKATAKDLELAELKLAEAAELLLRAYTYNGGSGYTLRSKK